MVPVSIEILGLLFLFLLNGVFSMSEIAVVTARKPRLRQRAAEGDARAATALELAETPNLFLSTVQIGVTLLGVASGALGGASLAGRLATLLARVSWLAPYSETVALVIVLGTITYLSVVIGELVPKRLAMSRPEQIASLMARPMRLFATVSAPVVHLLSISTRILTRALGIRADGEPPVTDEEIESLFREGTEAGVFEEAEQDMVKGVLTLGDRRASALMTPRPEMVWLDVGESREGLLAKLAEFRHSRFPVAQGSLDHIIGEVQAKDLLLQLLRGEEFDIGALVRPPLYVPEVMPALRVLETLKQSGTELALVINEYGSVEGLVTLADVMEDVVGEVVAEEEEAQPEIVQREDGSWLVDAMVTIDELKELLDVPALPDEETGLYQTVAGFMVLELGHIPSVAERYEWDGLRFEVLDMAGQRVNRVLVSEIPPAPPVVEGEREHADGNGTGVAP
ncbi:MAG: HlyC/CorC family transporter [Chloroflexi bacterium]|nr:HlyC/CorC family transporter [Chloroflexota bacterium]